MEEKHLIGIATLFVVVCVALGTGMYYAGYYADRPSDNAPRIDITQDLMKEISAEKISEYLKHLTSVPHLAGTDQDFEQAEWLRQNFEDFGLDQAFVVPYEVLLSYPNMTQPNRVYLMNGTEAVLTTAGRQEPLYADEEYSPLVAPNFNAYSGTGTPESDGLVYVYFGQESHYDYLESQGINVSGKIVLARYGATFRANIVDLAEKRGAIGVLLFSDPKEFAQQGRNQKYPDSWWMPGMAVQSGTVYLDSGDPLTPFYPSIESAYRIPESEAHLPKIPCQPIGFDEAEVILSYMNEANVAPPGWTGDLNHKKYYLGPDFKFPNMTIKMEVLTTNQRRTTYNTIAIIEGEEEPDRYVLIGNHRDAWVLGAMDPSSGTAAMLEIARAFSVMKEKHGWRPRRSIVFCSWGAEEYGLIASTEWVENFAKVLSHRSIAYLNVDVAVDGNYSMRGMAAPLMHELFVESSKKIPNPNPSEVANGRSTVFDTWIKSYPDEAHPGFPKVKILGSGSDYTSFMHVIGVPSLDIRYTYEENILSYPLYHTLYETHHILADVLDQNFVHHRAVAQMWAEVAKNLTESTILPFDIRWYATYLKESFANIKGQYNAQLEVNGATLKYFEEAVNNFEKATENFQETLKQLDTKNSLAVRKVNDQLMLLERHFIDPHGLPNRPQYNHIVFAPSSSDNYASSSFSGLTDLLQAVEKETDDEQRQKEWAQIKQHLSVISFLIDGAAKSLSDYF